MTALTQFYGGVCDIPPCPKKSVQFTNLINSRSNRQPDPEIAALKAEIARVKADLALTGPLENVHAVPLETDEMAVRRMAKDLERMFGLRLELAPESSAPPTPPDISLTDVGDPSGFADAELVERFAAKFRLRVV